MDSITSLQHDLAALGESRRKPAELRELLDTAQNTLKALPGSDPLSAQPEPTARTLCAPLVVALRSGHSKLVAAALAPLVRLAAAQALPPAVVADVAAALHALDVPLLLPELQLKCVQLLPPLLAFLLDKAAFGCFAVVAARLAALQNPMVANTAHATSQQLYVALYSRDTAQIADADSAAAFASLQTLIFADLCAAVTGDAPTALPRDAVLKPPAALSTIESILALDGPALAQNPPLAAQLLATLAPALLRVLAAPAPQFATALLALRVVSLLVARHTDQIPVEAELLLALANHIMLDTGDRSSLAPAHPPWQRILVLEMLRSWFSSAATVRSLWTVFDADKTKKNAVLEIFSVLVALGDSHGSAVFKQSHDKPALAKAVAPKIPCLDQLDKAAPPQTSPLYEPLLVVQTILAFSSGVADYVAELPASQTPEPDLAYITALNTSVFPDVARLYDLVLHGNLDPDLFKAAVKTAQVYTHAIGVSGLDAQRDEMLRLFAAYIVTPAQPEDTKKSNLTALGESLAETIGAILPAEAQEPASRSFDARQYICLRAFYNLAISLGPTLAGSWEIVWTTLQWVDFHAVGLEHNGSLTGQRNEPKLSPAEMAGLDSLNAKVLQNMASYDEPHFADAYSTLIKLWLDPNLSIPAQHKAFFLKSLVKLATLDFTNFCFLESDLWAPTCEFFTKAALDRSTASPTRISLVESYTNILAATTRFAFQSGHHEGNPQRSLDALAQFLDALFALDLPSELLVLNCETEIHLTILTTLHKLIDEHEKHYEECWTQVFQILNTAFANADRQTIKDKQLQLVATSYDSLKLILDEFLQTLPFNQLKALVDTLANFCFQQFDLNISFSSVSYFWLISDCINSNIGPNTVRVNKDILDHIQVSEGTPEVYEGLSIYLLAKLSDISTDPRDQVRQGAIQTLFQILETQGTRMQSWDLLYDVVFPKLFESSNSKRDMASINLVLSGMVSICTKFMMRFDEISVKFWNRFFEYLQSLLAMRWNDLNLKIFQSFQDVLLVFKDASIPHDIQRLAFEFWVSVPIDYDFVRPEYQETLAVYNELFQLLYKLVPCSLDDVQRVLTNLNKCAKYPVLKPGNLDATKPTLLQRSVLANFAILNTADEEVLALLILQLAQVTAYPYEIRARIEAKLKSKMTTLSIPTFQALSEQAFEMLPLKITALSDIRVLLADLKLHRTVRSLLSLVKYKAANGLSVRADELIETILIRLIEVNDLEDSVWEVMVDCLAVHFDSDNETSYQRLSQKVVPALMSRAAPSVVSSFMNQVFAELFFYEPTAAEKQMIESAEASRLLTEFDFDVGFGTTEPLVPRSYRAMRRKCLSDLFEFARMGNTAAQEYVDVRVAFALRRFIAGEALLGKKPIPQAQEEEVLMVLSALDRSEKIRPLLAKTLVYADRIDGMPDLLARVI